MRPIGRRACRGAGLAGLITALEATVENEHYTGENCQADQSADDAAYDEAGLVVLVA